MSRKTVIQKEPAISHHPVHKDFLLEGEDVLRSVYFRMTQVLSNELVFLDPHLTITQLADMVGTNTNYITKVIQQYTQEDGFCDFINKLRVNFSKSMLSGRKKISLQKIALKSGYSSASAYQYNFKKFENVTPGTWRKNHHSSAASTALK